MNYVNLGLVGEHVDYILVDKGIFNKFGTIWIQLGDCDLEPHFMVDYEIFMDQLVDSDLEKIFKDGWIN